MRWAQRAGPTLPALHLALTNAYLRAKLRRRRRTVQGRLKGGGGGAEYKGGRCSACGKLTASKNLSGSGILASPTADAGAFLNLAELEPKDLSQSSSDLQAAAVATDAASAAQLWSRSNLCLRWV